MKTIKQLAKVEVWAAALFITLNMLTGNAFAQTTVPEQVDVNINTNSGGSAMWYAQPWVWVVGVALFIIIIIAITRSGSREV